MKALFKNTALFSIIFFAVLGIDIYVKLHMENFPYRYISKPIVILLLMGYFIVNQKETYKKKFLWVVLGLSCFLLGDFFLIEHENKWSLAAGISFFIGAKVFYGLKFSHTTDFELGRLVPFLLVIFAYMAVMFSFIYDNLGDLFAPILFYFFVSLLMVQMAFLRKNAVNFKSYMMVLIGVELLVVGETFMALKTFYRDIPFQDIGTMLFYGLAQYCIIIGVLLEKKDLKPLKEN